MSNVLRVGVKISDDTPGAAALSTRRRCVKNSRIGKDRGICAEKRREGSGRFFLSQITRMRNNSEPRGAFPMYIAYL